MSFTGHLVFVRSEHGPLLTAPVFDQLDAQTKVSIETWHPRPGGWQTLQLDHSLWEDERLKPLVEWSGAPVCVVEVSDSDVAVVTGLDPAGRAWQAVLNLDAAARSWAEEPEDLQDMSEWVDSEQFNEAVARKRAELEQEVADSARGALDWAIAAGVAEPVDQVSIEQVLRSNEVFVEDLFSTLIDALGFPGAET